VDGSIAISIAMRTKREERGGCKIRGREAKRERERERECSQIFIREAVLNDSELLLTFWTKTIVAV
jgi:hypothetical protein